MSWDTRVLLLSLMGADGFGVWGYFGVTALWWARMGLGFGVCVLADGLDWVLGFTICLGFVRGFGGMSLSGFGVLVWVWMFLNETKEVIGLRGVGLRSGFRSGFVCSDLRSCAMVGLWGMWGFGVGFGVGLSLRA